ncbi:MAG: DUF3486 family protein [Comamonadaceae bacterium]|nr:DUF3486 family protein [Comamonadaceae bacterium]
MARRSSVAKLPQDVRRWLERALEENGFGGYDELTRLLHEKGYQISRSSLHRWGQDIERQRAEIRAETEIAKALSEGSAADERDTRSEGVMALIQTGLLKGLRAMMDAQTDGVDPAERVALLAKVGKDAASMVRGSVELKVFQARWEEAARKRALAEAAETAATEAKRQGLSAQGVQALRDAIAGAL